MTLPLARRDVAVALVAAVIMAAWVVWTRGSAMPPVFPLGDQPTYSTADAEVVVLLEPLLHAPWSRAVAPSLALAAGTMVFAGAIACAAGAGASLLASILVAGLLATDRPFAALVGHTGGMALSIGLGWLALFCAFGRDQRFEVPGRRALAIGLWAGAVSASWIGIVLWPIAVGTGASGRTVLRRSAWVAGAVIAGAVALVAYGWTTASVAHASWFAPGFELGWQDVLAATFDPRADAPAGLYVGPDHVARLPWLALALAAIGLVVGRAQPRWRRVWIFGAASAVAAGLAWPAWREEIARYAQWVFTPIAAVGLTWAARQVSPARLTPTVTAVLGVVMIAEAAATGARPPGGRPPREFRDQLVAAIDRMGPGPLAFVAEDTRIDSALAAWLDRRPRAARLLPEAAVVAAAIEQGWTVLAGETGRRQLELMGMQFNTTAVVEEPARYELSPVARAYRCTQVRGDRWSQLPGLEYTGRLGLQIPGGAGGEVLLIVGDTLPLAVQAAIPSGQAFPMKIEPLLSGPGTATPPPDYWFEGGAPESAPDRVARLRLAANPGRSTLVGLGLGRRAPRVLARLSGFDASVRGRVCAAPVGADVIRTGRTGEVSIPLTASELFGAGWYGVEGRGETRMRWTDADAIVLVPSAVRADVRIRLDTAPAVPPSPTPVPGGGTEVPPYGRDAGDGASIALRVNGVEVSSTPMRAGMQRYEWDVPAGVWLAGTNEIWFHVSRVVRPADFGGGDKRSLAMSVTRLSVTRLP